MLTFTTLAFLLLAQDTGEDLQLATALARRGWVDLAGEICDRVEKSSSAGEAAKAIVPVVRAEIAFVRAQSEHDAARALQILESAVPALRATASIDAKSMMGWLLAQRGRMALEAADLEDDRERQAGFRAEAAKAYAAAEEHLRVFIHDLGKMASTEAVEHALLDARLELPRSMIGRARTATLEAAARRKLLEESVRLLWEYQLDASPRPISLEAQIEEAGGLKDLGDFAKAESRLRSALSGIRSLSGDFSRRLVSRATVGLASVLMAQGENRWAIDLIDGLLKANATTLSLGTTLTLRLEKAEALTASGNTGAAFAECQAVQKQDPEGPFGGRARRWIREHLLDHSRATPARLLAVATGCMEASQFQDALKFLRGALEACNDAAERVSIEPVAAFKRGECLRGLKRHLEAVEAYKDVFLNYPKHELAAQAGFEAVLCLNHEVALSGDRRFEEEMERLLQIVTKLGLKGTQECLLKYLEATILERKGFLAEAAALYRHVDPGCEVFERALLSAAHCWRLHALPRKNPPEPTAAAVELANAEEALLAAIPRLEKAGASPSNERGRLRLLLAAYQELVLVYLDERVKKAPEALGILSRWEKRLDPGESAARVWELEAHANLKGGDLDAACAILEKLLAKVPDQESTVRTLDAVAARLDRRAESMAAGREDEKAVRETFRTMGRYTKRWLDLAPSAGVKIGTNDLADAADRLYRAARRLNGLDESIGSFVDLKGKKVADAPAFQDAVSALTLLEGRGKELSEKDRMTVRTRLARCQGFVAADEKGWEKAKQSYDAVIRDGRLLGGDGQIDRDAARARPWLLSAYLEQGAVYGELARAGQKYQYDNALTVHGNLLRVLPHGSESWWSAKFITASLFFERGGPNDLKLVRLMLENLELNTGGEFDAGKYGMKEKFWDLREKVRKVAGR